MFQLIRRNSRGVSFRTVFHSLNHQTNRAIQTKTPLGPGNQLSNQPMKHRGSENPSSHPMVGGWTNPSETTHLKHTVDGRNLAPVTMVSISLFTGFYHHLRCLFGISSINGTSQIWSCSPGKVSKNPLTQQCLKQVIRIRMRIRYDSPTCEPPWNLWIHQICGV